MPILTRNKKAYYDYQILETFEAGIELLGHEVKSLKTKGTDMASAFVIVRDGQAFMTGLTISPYQAKNTPKDYDPQRTRKLLLHKKQINHLIRKTKIKGLTIVPIKIYTKKRIVKVEIAIARGKKKADKRQQIKKREDKREIERTLKQKLHTGT